MSKVKVTGTVDKQGRLVPDAPHVWVIGLQDLAGKRVVITVETEKRRKTLDQLGYYRGVIVPFFVEQWSRKNRYPLGLPPYDPDDISEILIKHTIGYEEEPGPMGEPLRKKVRKADTVLMSELIDQSRALALELFKVAPPLPNEPWEVLG